MDGKLSKFNPDINDSEITIGMAISETCLTSLIIHRES